MTQEKIKTERNNLQFRVTKEFKTEYIADAKEAGMTATDYFKWLAKKEKPRTIKATPYQEAMFSLLAEFKCVASNVNQIAKVMNTEKKTFYTVTVKEDLIARTLATVQTVSSDIIKQINYGSPWQDQGERQSASQLPDEEGGQ